jgi:hypothetical protein
MFCNELKVELAPSNEESSMLKTKETTQERRKSAPGKAFQEWNDAWDFTDSQNTQEHQDMLKHRGVLEDVLQSLNDDDTATAPRMRLMAANWLGLNAADIAVDVRMLDDALYHLNKRTNDESFQVRRAVWDASRSLWDKGWEQQAEKSNGMTDQMGIVLRRVLKVLQIQKQHREFKIAAAKWLEKRSVEIAADSRMMGDTIEALINRAKMDPDPDVRRSAVDAGKMIWDRGWNKDVQSKDVQNKKVQRQVFRYSLHALQVKECWEVREAAALWLGENAVRLSQVSNGRMMADALSALMVRAKQDDVAEVRKSAVEASRDIWSQAWQKTSTSDMNRKATTVQINILRLVLKALEKEEKGDDWDIRRVAIEWLGEMAEHIAYFQDNHHYMRVADTLASIRADESEPEDLRMGAVLTQDALWDALREHRYDTLESVVRAAGSLERSQADEESSTQESQMDGGAADAQPSLDTDEISVTMAIWELADPNYMGSRDALSFLIKCWIDWIRMGVNPQLVEFTAEAIRYNPYTVLALIEHYGKNEVRNSNNHKNNNDKNALSLEMTVTEAERLRRYLKRCLQDWEECDRGRIELLDEAELLKAELFLNSPAANGEKAEDMMSALREMVVASRALMIDRRIARQLTDMSNPAFFEETEQGRDKAIKAYEYERILKELRMHAVPVVLKQLADEKEDREVRSNIVRLLGYSGGREAIDALARQAASKEKDRKNRHDLLDEYYLQPSKARNDHTSEILKRSVDESKRNLQILQLLNIFQFAIGILVLLGGTIYGILSEDASTQTLGGLAAIGGTAGVIRLLLKNPLDRIQSSLAKLVQLETAFTTFIWELNLNGTYIQSCYVEDGELENEEIKETVNMVQKSAELTMSQVYKYAEIRNYPRIDRLVPSPQKKGDEVEVTIIGQHLAANNKQKNLNNLIYINNEPVIASGAKWEENQVAFTLPADKVPPKAEVSLFVNGMETNSLSVPERPSRPEA